MRGQRHAPGALYPRERPGTNCTGDWVGPRTGLDRCGKYRPPPGFDPQTVRPIASRYTDYATRPTTQCVKVLKMYHEDMRMHFSYCSITSTVSNSKFFNVKNMREHKWTFIDSFVMSKMWGFHFLLLSCFIFMLCLHLSSLFYVLNICGSVHHA